MKKTTHNVTALMIARITGSITPKEDTCLEHLLNTFPQVKNMYQFLQENMPADTGKDEATLKQEARNIIRLAEERTAATPKIMPLPVIAIAACTLAVAVLAIKTWTSHTPRQQRAIVTAIDSTSVTLSLGKDILPLSGRKLTIDLGKGLLINDTQLLRPITSGEQTLIATLTVPPGKVYTVQLSDGSRAAINSATQLKFPLQFTDRERPVQVNGEAFLTVNANANRPFVVHLPHTDVIAMGTQFNVNSYKENQPRVALVSGSAKVVSSTEARQLKPGQAVTRVGATLQVSPMQIDETGWLKGQIYAPEVNQQEIITLTWRYWHKTLTIDEPLPYPSTDVMIKRYLPIDSFLVQVAPLHRVHAEGNGYRITPE